MGSEGIGGERAGTGFCQQGEVWREKSCLFYFFDSPIHDRICFVKLSSGNWLVLIIRCGRSDFFIAFMYSCC